MSLNYVYGCARDETVENALSLAVNCTSMGNGKGSNSEVLLEIEAERAVLAGKGFIREALSLIYFCCVYFFFPSYK